MSDEIGESLKDTILKSELPALMNELGEIGIDSLLADGVLKDIPVLGSVLAIGKTYGNVRDYLFTKKINKISSRANKLEQPRTNKSY